MQYGDAFFYLNRTALQLSSHSPTDTHWPSHQEQLGVQCLPHGHLDRRVRDQTLNEWTALLSHSHPNRVTFFNAKNLQFLNLSILKVSLWFIALKKRHSQHLRTYKYKYHVVDHDWRPDRAYIFPTQSGLLDTNSDFTSCYNKAKSSSMQSWKSKFKDLQHCVANTSVTLHTTI